MKTISNKQLLPHYINNYVYKNRDYLINKEKWDSENLEGELNIYNSLLIEEAFLKILEDFIPHKPYCIISLCSASRPYYKSPKWEKLIDVFGFTCDLIVGSNGGIIPREYWECYPYLEYDAHRQVEYDALYVEKFKYRLNAFLKKFSNKYEKIIFLFNPLQRNYGVCKELTLIYDNTILIPDELLYGSLDINHIRGGYYKRFQEIIPDVLKVVAEQTNTKYEPTPEEIYVDKHKITMKDMLKSLYDEMEENVGYTKNQLLGYFNWKFPYNYYRDAYKSMVINKCCKNIDRSKWGVFLDLFILKEGKYFKINKN